MQRLHHQPQRVRFLGRLSTLTSTAPWALCGITLVASMVVGCDDKKANPNPTMQRNDHIVAHSSQPSATAPPSASQTPEHPPATKRKTFCAKTGSQSGKTLPKQKLKVLTSKEAAVKSASVSGTKGKWLWLNMWAAWCGPCKREMPLLLEWQKKSEGTKHAFQLEFLSLDDDERQAHKFLDSQAPKELKKSFWLPEGKERDSWLKGMSWDDSPTLPVQILVDPQGTIKCVMEGDVEAEDWPTIQKFLSK
jgi:thiol-disulfide isomerase/thioredoxin